MNNTQVMRLANHEIQQLGHNPGQHQADKETFRFIPEPGTHSLCGQLKLSLQLESVVVQAEAQRLADQEQEDDGEYRPPDGAARGSVDAREPA